MKEQNNLVKKELSNKDLLTNKIIKEIITIIKTFVICFIAVFIFTQLIAKPIKVSGDSMNPTLKDGNIGFTNVFSAKTSSINRLEIVIVKAKHINELWVKRVIGLPGEVIEVKNDKVYIDGVELIEEFLNNDYVKSQRKNGLSFTEDFPATKLGEDEYFLMGDNRRDSYDSRFIGSFNKSDIVGKDVFVLYPFNNIKIVND